jgi:hypothetical protein
MVGLADVTFLWSGSFLAYTQTSPASVSGEHKLMNSNLETFSLIVFVFLV